ncbi:hypothetical protein [Amycolatopsis sp. cg9]|uniref:hypothetical protein n=1 Tax=Amycolatopsis sp. cg9 TaxID=3238801 RepID=UPI0035236D3E
MSYSRARFPFAALVVVLCAACALTGCGKVAKAAATAAEWEARAAEKQVLVHNAVSALDGPTAKAGVTELEGISKSAHSAAATEGTAAARESARKATTSYRSAERENRTSWIDDFRAELEDEAKKEIRSAFRRAACDEVGTMLADGTPLGSRWYAAEVALYLHGEQTDADSVGEAFRVATEYFSVLRDLDPRNPDDQAVLSYLAYTAFCPDAVASLRPQTAGWGVVLTDQPVKVVDAGNRPVGTLAPGALVRIDCTLTWFAVEGPYGTSSLWNFVGTGYVPDSYLYTGTDQPVAAGC